MKSLSFPNKACLMASARSIVDIYSISNCVSKHFADYIKFWKHNGYWFFNSPEIIRQLAQENSIDLKGGPLCFTTRSTSWSLTKPKVGGRASSQTLNSPPK